ncbi:MAG TPA: hypothetical protein VFX19_00530 [Dehalococcoidia bacterium]|nr:hypothetical protein [Dehalococcoidia bacterium]
MVGEPADIEVTELIWLEASIAHIAKHGLSQSDVEEVLDIAPQFFEDLPGRSGTHIILGPNASGRFIYVVIAPEEFEGEWVVVTAFPYNRRRAMRHYREI